MIEREAWEWLILGVATWRISSMLVREYGPWGVFERLRERLGVEHSVEDNATYYDRKNAMTCVWCLSVWIGLVLVFVPLIVAMPFALSGLSILYERAVTYGSS